MVPKERRFWLFFGALFVLIAIFILFVVPDSALYSEPQRHSGYVFLGLRELFGDFGARYFTALPFALVGWVSFRRAWNPPPFNSSEHEK